MASIRTDPDEFRRFHELLTQNRPDYEPCYVVLREGHETHLDDKGKVKVDGKSPTKADRHHVVVSFDEAIRYLEHGINIGIKGLPEDDLLIVDVDDMEAIPFDSIKETLCVKSRSRAGFHHFFFVDRSDERISRNMAVKHVGEMRTFGQYTVAPGSWVTTVDIPDDEIPDDEKENVGKYTIETGVHVSDLVYEELPELFREQIELEVVAKREAEKLQAESAARREKYLASGHGKTGNDSRLFALEMFDVINESHPPTVRFKNPLHPHATGTTAQLNGAVLSCYSCNVTHTPLSALAVLAGLADCKSAGKGFASSGVGPSTINYHDGKTVFTMWKYAKQNGVLPKDDPVPSHALRWYAVDQGITDAKTIHTREDADEMPLTADEYNRAISLIEAKEEISAGRGQVNPYLEGRDTPMTTPEGEAHELTSAEIAEIQQNEFDLRLEANLPEDHFITAYTKWMQTITDGYPDYAVTCGLWVLSAIANEKTVLRLRQGRIRPNLWIINLGRSTTSRKSTIINKTRQIFESATDTSLPNEDYSLEGYLETLSIDPVMNNVRDEMSGLLAKYHKKYNDGIFDLECVIYDCEGIQKTLASGRNKQPKTFNVENSTLGIIF